MLVPSISMLRFRLWAPQLPHFCLDLSSARLALRLAQPQTQKCCVRLAAAMQGRSQSSVPPPSSPVPFQLCVPIWPQLLLALQACSCRCLQPQLSSGQAGTKIVDEEDHELLCCHVQQQLWNPLIFSEPLRCNHRRSLFPIGRRVLNKPSMLSCRAFLSQYRSGSFPPDSTR